MLSVLREKPLRHRKMLSVLREKSLRQRKMLSVLREKPLRHRKMLSGWRAVCIGWGGKSRESTPTVVVLRRYK